MASKKEVTKLIKRTTAKSSLSFDEIANKVEWGEPTRSRRKPFSWVPVAICASLVVAVSGFGIGYYIHLRNLSFHSADASLDIPVGNYSLNELPSFMDGFSKGDSLEIRDSGSSGVGSVKLSDGLVAIFGGEFLQSLDYKDASVADGLYSYAGERGADEYRFNVSYLMSDKMIDMSITLPDGSEDCLAFVLSQ